MRALTPPMVMIVGTPRSGTTLVQRLVGEQCGIVVPPETHLLGAFARVRLRPADFPLRGDALRRVLDEYAARDWVDVDAASLASALGGECTSLRQLLCAVVGEATGWAARRGEKTPAHVRWIPYLLAALPETLVVVVVRDPRAVVASVLERRWSSGSAVGEALRWRLDQRRALDRWASDARVVVVRYEDVVADANRALAPVVDRLGAGDGPVEAVADLRRPAEVWKERAGDAVDPSRADAWTSTLTASRLALVEAIAGRRARSLGYDVPRRSWLTLARLRAADVRAVVRLTGYNLRTRLVVARFTRAARQNS